MADTDAARIARPEAGGLRGYRPDVDGLRALAVISVVVFHVRPDLLPGGFLGVDVFFVISGFLITRLILAELEAGEFSFARFYERRARRLFPAMFVTLAATFAVGALLLAPDHLQRLAGSLVYALLSASNFHFWQEAGYFDAAGTVKPLLHTWSLAVEEQFYLLWPATLVLVHRWRAGGGVIAVVLAGALLSLLGAELLREDHAGAVFYLVPFRVFELGLGAACIWLIRLRPTDPRVLDAIAALGLLMVVAAVFLLDEADPLPGLLALLPCGGAAALICVGDATRLRPLLANRAAVGIGLVSYSLYLVHWPLIVYYRYWQLAAPGLGDAVLLVVASIALAALMYRFVERPFRRPSGRRLQPAGVGFVCALLSLVLCVPAADAWANSGWGWRFRAEIRALVEAPRMARSNALVRVRDREPFPREGRSNGVIIGDSHATDLFNALAQNDVVVNLRRLGIGVECQPVVGSRPSLPAREARRCERRFQRILDSDELRASDHVLFSARWQDWAVDRLPETVAAIRERTAARIVVFGPTVEYEPEVPMLIARHGRLEGLDAWVDRFRVAERQAVNERLRTAAASLGVDYVDKIATLCGSGPCPLMTPDGHLPVFVDYGHWSMDGALLFGRRLATSNPGMAFLFPPARRGTE